MDMLYCGAPGNHELGSPLLVNHCGTPPLYAGVPKLGLGKPAISLAPLSLTHGLNPCRIILSISDILEDIFADAAVYSLRGCGMPLYAGSVLGSSISEPLISRPSLG